VADSGILIRNWDQLQHFKDRDPIWIKLYRALRHNRRWRQLSGDGCKLYIDLMLLAAEDEPFGTIQLLPAELAWEVRLEPEELFPLLLEVAGAGLVTVVGYHDDVKLLSAGDQGGDVPLSLTRSREVEGEVEKEKETTNVQPNGRDSSILYVDPLEWRRFEKDFRLAHREPLDVALQE
jgi:hypothetical protein